MNQNIIAFIIGILVGGLFIYAFINETAHLSEQQNNPHPIGYADNEEEVHVHSDFLVYLDGVRIDLSDDKYQTSNTQTLHKHVHLHDNNDDVIHRHDRGITLGDFFGSLGFTLGSDRITTDAGVTFLNSDTDELMVFVNDERIEDPAEYVTQEEDRVLIYFGNKNDNETIQALLLEVTDKSCIYSGTCPERGTAPPESCGLTCEL